MTPEQIRARRRGSDRVPPPVMLALRLLLLTGQQPGEVAGLQVAEIDLEAEEGPVWRIPAERRKNGPAHAVALAPEAAEVIHEALTLSDGLHLFPSATGGPGRVDSGMNKALRTIFDDVDGRPTPHSGRHSVATELEGLGCEEGEIARVLGHQSRTVTGAAYVNRRSLSTQRKTLEMWTRRLNEILTGDVQPANVVPLRREL